MSGQMDELGSDDVGNHSGSEAFHPDDGSEGNNLENESGTCQNKSNIAGGNGCFTNRPNIEQDAEIDDAGCLAL